VKVRAPHIRLRAVAKWLVGAIAVGVLVFFGLIALVRSDIPAPSDIWTVTARFSRLKPNWGPDGYGAWFNCAIEIGSKEVPDFVQRTQHGVFIGLRPQPIGGIHDWIVFHELRTWPPARRIALLKYLASRRSPLLIDVARMDSAFWQYAFDEGYIDLPREPTLRIASSSGVASKDLFSVALDGSTHEVLGFRPASGEFVRVVPPEPGSVVSTFAPRAFLDYALEFAAYPYSEPTTGTAWYPTYLPDGFELASVETTTLGEGLSDVCDIVFAKGGSNIVLSQGSAVMRDYEVVPISTVQWGTDHAWTMDSDGEPGGRQFIVYWDPRNLAELSGDVSISELKQMAASMRPVP
jgi:hypothetical protein